MCCASVCSLMIFDCPSVVHLLSICCPSVVHLLSTWLSSGMLTCHVRVCAQFPIQDQRIFQAFHRAEKKCHIAMRQMFKLEMHNQIILRWDSLCRIVSDRMRLGGVLDKYASVLDEANCDVRSFYHCSAGDYLHAFPDCLQLAAPIPDLSVTMKDSMGKRLAALGVKPQVCSFPPHSSLLALLIWCLAPNISSTPCLPIQVCPRMLRCMIGKWTLKRHCSAQRRTRFSVTRAITIMHRQLNKNVILSRWVLATPSISMWMWSRSHALRDVVVVLPRKEPLNQWCPRSHRFVHSLFLRTVSVSPRWD